MKTQKTEKMVMEELRQIPPTKLPEIYDILHHFRLGLEGHKTPVEKIISFSGSWSSMSQETFAEMLSKTHERRKNAFSSRGRP